MFTSKKIGAIIILGTIFATLLLVFGIVSCAGKFLVSSPPTKPNAQLQAAVQKNLPPLQYSNRSPNYTGININAPHDWSEDRLYANVITMSRPFTKGTDANDTAAGLAPGDADGWPASDFSFYVWHGIANMHGTYTLSFKGQANVVSSIGKIFVAYNPATNESSGKIIYKNKSSSFLSLSFTSTKRSAASAATMIST